MLAARFRPKIVKKEETQEKASHPSWSSAITRKYYGVAPKPSLARPQCPPFPPLSPQIQCLPAETATTSESFTVQYQDPWHLLTGNHPTRVALVVCQGGQTPVEAYVGIKQAYLGSFGWVVGRSVIPGISWYKPTYDVRVLFPPNFCNLPPFCSVFILYSIPLFVGRKDFCPMDREIPNQGI